MHPINEMSTPERKGKAIKVFTPAIQIKYPERNGQQQIKHCFLQEWNFRIYSMLLEVTLKFMIWIQLEKNNLFIPLT